MNQPAFAVTHSQSTSSPVLSTWLAQHSQSFDTSNQDAHLILPKLGEEGLFRIGVPTALGGVGGTTADAMQAIAQTAEDSLTAAFVFWGQRTFIEYLVRSPNTELRDTWLPRLLEGSLAGATGLSNAMKFLSGFESLQLHAQAKGEGWELNGKLPWVTNLDPRGFLVAAAVAIEGQAAPAVMVLSSEDLGLTRSEDLNLVALRGSNTAAIDVKQLYLGQERLLHQDALTFCPAIRPAFLSLQCGLSLGLARASLSAAVEQAGRYLPPALEARISQLKQQLNSDQQALEQGLAQNTFVADAASLFRLRIQLAERVQQAVALELEASGGRAYLLDFNPHFARRLKESAFVPVVTPSLAQLQGELDKQEAVGA